LEEVVKRIREIEVEPILLASTLSNQDSQRKHSSQKWSHFPFLFKEWAHSLIAKVHEDAFYLQLHRHLQQPKQLKRLQISHIHFR